MCGEALKSKLAFRGAHMKYTPKFLRGMLLSMIREINAVFQVKERIHVPEVPAVLPGRAGAVGGRVLRVGGGFQR